MHQRDGADPVASLGERGLRLITDDPPRLHPQQRRHHLQVVLDPMMHFPQRGIFCHQGPLSPPNVADIADQHERPARSRIPNQRNALN